jgi:glycosyltransferase involved in cell wall biosynthesis
LFESWACGVPFVSADVGDRALLLGDPPAGRLAQPGNADALAAALLEVILNPTISAQLIQRGFHRVEQYYWDTIGQQLDLLYRNEP